ncbi:MAG TPA: glycosyltransferase, partial [Ilumatobacteraceae bacterium]|nr:glycosyltransferase [Ilumatobacteraceae bacterium]
MRPVRVFAAKRGNQFMTDIANWVVEAATISGRDAELVVDRLPAADGSINLVVAPHEFYVLTDADDDAIRVACAASVPICTEQPGTPWYRLGLQFVTPSAMALDINQHGVDALVAAGVPARRLALGGVPSMNHQQSGVAIDERSIEVLFLGGNTGRRAAELAALAPRLWNRACELRTFRFSRPVGDGVPGLVFGEDKYRLLARSQILLNLHRDDVTPGYFEWARMMEAMANGCVVLTEPSTGYEPLIAGKHFVEADDIGTALEELFNDPQRMRSISTA